MKKKVKVGFILQANNNWMGGILYIKNLIKVMAAQDLSNYNLQIFLVLPQDFEISEIKDIEKLVTKISFEKKLNSNIFQKAQNKLLKLLNFEISFLENFVKSEKLDFLYPITANVDITWNYSCSWAAWIPDFQHRYLPELFSKREINSRDINILKLSSKAKKVVFSSESALKDYKRFYPESKSKTYVLQFRTIPVDKWYCLDPISIQDKYKLPNKFFIICNQFWAHKNHKIVLEALLLLKQRNIFPTIVCTGKYEDYRSQKHIAEIAALVSDNHLEEQFIVLGLIPRDDQIQLIRRSLAVIQPSLFEGWSTVVEDARLLGKNIILSDLDVHLEQNPPFASFYKRSSAIELSEKIEFLMPILTPGPNIELEDKGREINNDQSKLFAENFLHIAIDE